MTYALPSRTTCRTPSIDDAHLGHLMVRPLVDWVVFVVLGNSCAVQNGTSRVAGSIGDTTCQMHFRVHQWRYESNHTGKSRWVGLVQPTNLSGFASRRSAPAGCGGVRQVHLTPLKFTQSGNVPSGSSKVTGQISRSLISGKERCWEDLPDSFRFFTHP